MMATRPTRLTRICALGLVAAALAASAVALAEAAGPAATPTAKRIKALRKLTARLSKEVAALESQTANLEASRTPTTLPPGGPAGGALTGTYPSPMLPAGSIGSLELGEGAAGSAEIEDGSILGADIALRSIGSEDIAIGSLGREDFGGVIGAFTMAREEVVAPLVGPAIPVDDETRTVQLGCGTRVLSGGWRWRSSTGRVSIMASSPVFPENGGNPNFTWQVIGRVEGGAPELSNELLPSVLCLR